MSKEDKLKQMIKNGQTEVQRAYFIAYEKEGKLWKEWYDLEKRRSEVDKEITKSKSTQRRCIERAREQGYGEEIFT